MFVWWMTICLPSRYSVLPIAYVTRFHHRKNRLNTYLQLNILVKVRLSLFTSWRHMAERRYSSSHSHPLRLTELSSSYPARLTVGTHWTGDRVGPRDCLDASEKKYRFPLQEIERRFLERRTRGPDIIPTALSILTNVSTEVSVLKAVLIMSQSREQVN